LIQSEIRKMTISFECDCGKQYNVAEKNAGRSIRCADCGETVTVPGGASRSSSGPTRKRPQKRRPQPVEEYDEYDEYEEYDEYDSGGTSRDREDDYDEYEDDYEPKRRRPQRKKRSRKARRTHGGEEEKSGAAMMGSGVLMVVGGAAWLILGLMNDLFYPYTIILIVLGLISFFKGLIKSAS
jgi:hypothetical protein